MNLTKWVSVHATETFIEWEYSPQGGAVNARCIGHLAFPQETVYCLVDMNARCLRATLFLFALLCRPLAAGGLGELPSGSLLTAVEEWGIERLEVDAACFDFEYRGGAGPVTRVEVFGSADERFSIERDGALLSIRAEERMLLAGGSRGRILVTGPAMMELAVTAEGGSVSIQTVGAPELSVYGGSGTLSIDRVEARLSLYSNSGDIAVAGSSGSKRIITDSGDVIVRNSEGDLTVRTSAGRVNMWDVEGSLDVETVSGAIDIVGIKLREQGRVVTNSGRIDVVFAQELDELDLDVSTVSGAIQIADQQAEMEGVYIAPATPITEPDEVPGLVEETDRPMAIPFSGYSVSGHQYYR